MFYPCKKKVPICPYNSSGDILHTECHHNARPRGYKTFFMLNSTEHEISTAQKKLKYRQIKKFLALSFSDVIFIMLINVKMPIIVGILTFMSRTNFVLSWVEHEKSFITSGPVLTRSTQKQYANANLNLVFLFRIYGQAQISMTYSF